MLRCTSLVRAQSVAHTDAQRDCEAKGYLKGTDTRGTKVEGLGPAYRVNNRLDVCTDGHAGLLP